MSSYSSPASPAKAADGVDAAQDVAADVRGVSLADVLQGVRVAENGERFLELSEVLRTNDHGRIVAVARDHDTLVLKLNPINDLGEMVSNGSQRFSGHSHNCGRPGTCLSRGSAAVLLANPCVGPEANPDGWRGVLLESEEPSGVREACPHLGSQAGALAQLALHRSDDEDVGLPSVPRLARRKPGRCGRGQGLQAAP